MKRVTPEMLQQELKKLNSDIEINIKSEVLRLDSKVDVKIVDLQKST